MVSKNEKRRLGADGFVVPIKGNCQDGSKSKEIILLYLRFLKEKQQTQWRLIDKDWWIRLGSLEHRICPKLKT
jgi:hypothetical protein